MKIYQILMASLSNAPGLALVGLFIGLVGVTVNKPFQVYLGSTMLALGSIGLMGIAHLASSCKQN